MTPDVTIAHLAAKAAQAVPRQAGRPVTCPHLPDAKAGGICGLHPDRIHCPDCLQAHAAGHGVELEHTCDHCDAVTDNVCGFVSRWVAQIRRRGRGVDALIPVVIGGLGLCADCLTQVDCEVSA